MESPLYRAGNYSVQLTRAPHHLEQIMALQHANVEEALSAGELKKEGFVTVHHTLDLLLEIGGRYGHTVIFKDNQVVGYALTMLKSYGKHVPVLVPMFNQINQLSYQGTSLAQVEYVMMGQICVAKALRGQGLVGKLYEGMRRGLNNYFLYVITQVAQRNPRSIRAHEKVGFRCIQEYHTPEEHWHLLLWDWQ